MNHLSHCNNIPLKKPSFFLILYIFFAIFFPTKLLAQVNNSRFKHITLENGLQQSSILALFQDSNGFIWIGTEDGLHKYDGYNFKIFSHQSEAKNALSNSRINSITEDQSGNLWIGTDFGLNKLDLETETVEQVFQIDSAAINERRCRIYQLLFDPLDSILWIGSDGGLDRLELAKQTKDSLVIEHQPFIKQDSVRIPVISLLLDSNNDLWFGTEFGLGKLDQKTQKPNFSFVEEGKLVFDIEEDRDGFIWCSSNKNVEFFHRDSSWDNANKVRLSKTGDLKYHYNIPLCRDTSGNIWAATIAGLFQIRSRNGKILRLIKNYDDLQRPTRYQYTTMVQDTSQMFWIGTYGGINLFNLDEQRFDHYKVPKVKTPEGSSGFIRSIYEDHKGTTWFGTQAAGLFFLEKDSIVPKTFNIPIINEYDFGMIGAIVEDPDGGDIWFGTNTNGLMRINRNRSIVTKIDFLPNLLKKIESKSNLVNTLFVDSMGYIWIGSWNYLIRYDTKKDTFLYAKNPLEKPINIRSIAQDSTDMLWIGTLESGLFKFHPDSITNLNPEIRPVTISGPDTKQGGYKRINNILPDHNSILWLCTYGGGLLRMDTKADTFSFFNASNTNLPNDIIYGILKDETEHFWLSSNKGISRFYPPDSSVWTFDFRDGLQGNEFNSGVCHKSSKGKMYFGGINGFNVFGPDRIKKNPFIPPIVFTDFQINNQSVSIGESILKKHICFTDTLILSYQQKNLSFEVAALDYYIPEKNQYAYQLENYDKDWIYIGNRRFFNYTNLEPGNYILKVKGSNHDGVWNEEGKSIYHHYSATLVLECLVKEFLCDSGIRLVIWYLSVFIISTINQE